MTIGHLALLCICVLMTSSCATSAPDRDDRPGIRREPCGGGPVFPPEENAAAPQEEPGR